MLPTVITSVPESDHSTIGGRLRWLIEEHLGKKQAEFARSLGVTPQMLSRWVNNRHIPSVEHGRAIARNTGVSEIWLLLGEGKPFYEEPAPVATRDDVVRPAAREVEEYIGKIIDPDMLRRLAGTPSIVDVVIATKGAVARKPWPREVRDAADLYLNQFLPDGETEP